MRNPFNIDDATIEEFRQKFKDAVQPQVDEEVLAVGPFQRAGQYLLSFPLIGQVGAVFYLLYQAAFKRRAGGLPMDFLLAVTPTKVHAFKYRPGGYGPVRLKHEVAAWNRDDIQVESVTDGSISARVRLAIVEDGRRQTIVCNTPQLGGKMMSRPVLDLLGGAGATDGP